MRTVVEILIPTLLTIAVGGKMGKEISFNSDKKSEPSSEETNLSERDTRLLLVICAELANLLAKVTGTVDPAAAAMLAYVRDDIRFELKPLDC